MAGYRHILVIPPTAKVLPPKNEKPPTAKNIAAVLHYRRKNTAIFCFFRFRQKSTANSQYRQKSTANSQYRQKSTTNSRYGPKGTANTGYRPKRTADTGYRPKGTADTGYRRKGTAYTGYRPKSTGFSFGVRSLFFVLFGSSGSFSVEPLCGLRTERRPGTCPYTCPHTCPHHAQCGPAE